ncbi:hypothetical protein [Hamadaea tsunoensis]|uniref:hypothetical protein n=1 Tax=Hamadaea tsunoensis TaxID=53368 RepID=UPI000413909C|nr:hypothetical protein [Hamadaea tsunoensis]
MTTIPHRGTLGSRLAWKIFIGLSFGTITYTVSNLVQNSQIVSVGLSVFISGVVVVVEFLIEVEQRMDRLEVSQEAHARATHEKITAGINRINEATELYGAVEASAVKSDEVTQLVRHATRIPEQPDLVTKFVQMEISRMSRFLMEVSKGGDVVYEGEDRDWMLGLARTAQKTIDATSLSTVDAGGRGFVDGGLWTSDLGQRYLDIQRERIDKADVVIRRIFIMDRPDLLADPDFQQVIGYHKDLKVKVRVLDPTSVVGTPLSSLIDFIVFDGVVSYEAQVASRIQPNSRPIIVSTRLVLQEDRVRERRQKFEDLWNLGKDY